MNEDLEDFINTLENSDLFQWRLQNIQDGYFQEAIGWVYHEGDLYIQIYNLVSDQHLSGWDDDYKKIVIDLTLKQIQEYTDLLMLHLLKGDYKPEMTNPSIRDRIIYKRKRKKRDVDRNDRKQLKMLSRWVRIPL